MQQCQDVTKHTEVDRLDAKVRDVRGYKIDLNAARMGYIQSYFFECSDARPRMLAVAFHHQLKQLRYFDALGNILSSECKTGSATDEANPVLERVKGEKSLCREPSLREKRRPRFADENEVLTMPRSPSLPFWILNVLFVFCLRLVCSTCANSSGAILFLPAQLGRNSLDMSRINHEKNFLIYSKYECYENCKHARGP